MSDPVLMEDLSKRKLLVTANGTNGFREFTYPWDLRNSIVGLPTLFSPWPEVVSGSQSCLLRSIEYANLGTLVSVRLDYSTPNGTSDYKPKGKGPDSSNVVIDEQSSTGSETIMVNGLYDKDREVWVYQDHPMRVSFIKYYIVVDTLLDLTMDLVPYQDKVNARPVTIGNNIVLRNCAEGSLRFDGATITPTWKNGDFGEQVYFRTRLDFTLRPMDWNMVWNGVTQMRDAQGRPLCYGDRAPFTASASYPKGSPVLMPNKLVNGIYQVDESKIGWRLLINKGLNRDGKQETRGGLYSYSHFGELMRLVRAR